MTRRGPRRNGSLYGDVLEELFSMVSDMLGTVRGLRGRVRCLREYNSLVSIAFGVLFDLSIQPPFSVVACGIGWDHMNPLRPWPWLGRVDCEMLVRDAGEVEGSRNLAGQGR